MPRKCIPAKAMAPNEVEPEPRRLRSNKQSESTNAQKTNADAQPKAKPKAPNEVEPRRAVRSTEVAKQQSKRAAPAQKSKADAQPKQSKDASAPRKRTPAKARSSNEAQRSDVRAAQISEGNTRKLTPKQKNEQLKQKLQQLLEEL